ncbi:hypothetical protein [uncultured Polaribacter sp.]|uniref:hypothetical protein n=1 Tax=uncultured Polaribacter sp. TaxID=174711 RepID=UPI00261FA8F1|nr:hypothetical protein [uncultured Polaribacter sp.]
MKREKKIEEIERNVINVCGNKVLEIRTDVYEKPFLIKYYPAPKHNMDNCMGCKRTHKTILEKADIHFKEFPDCCKEHSRLSKHKFYSKSDFYGLETMIADKILFTHHHIVNNLFKENWYLEITNYIDYAYQSFGSLPINCGEPPGLSWFLDYLIDIHLSHKLESLNVGLEDRHNKIIDYIKRYRGDYKKGDNRHVDSKDFNLMLNIYDKWYKYFPFELAIFSGLQKHFSNRLPLFEDESIYNPYLKITQRKLLSKEQLLKHLLKITKQILSAIDTTQFLEDDYITNKTKYEFDLKKKTHKLKQESLLREFSKGEKEYMKTIKKWLDNEKSFLKEIQPSIKQLPAIKNNVKHNFETILSDQVKRQYVFDLLENLSIISNGQSILSTRKKGALRGVVEALREANILPHLGIDKLCTIIAKEIGLELRSKLDYSDISKKFQKDAKQYIKDNPLH